MARAGASTTRVLVLPKMINMNILKTLYSSTTQVVIFQYSYSYVQYSPQPCWRHQAITWTNVALSSVVSNNKGNFMKDTSAISN